jgi:uncharacterized protein
VPCGGTLLRRLAKNEIGQGLTADTFWLAIGLVLIIEGLVPFSAPAKWRQMFLQMLQLNDGQLRFFGICSISAGLLLICWLA